MAKIIVLLSICMSTIFDSSLMAQSQEESQYKDAGGAHFRFAQIRVPVWVRNRHGKPISDLGKKDFTLYVDGEKIPIAYFTKAYDQEVDILFLLDLSGSMALGRKLEGSMEVISFLIHALGPKDHWQLVVFADKQVLKVLDDRQADKLDSVFQRAKAYGKTALYDALLKAPEYFEGRGDEQRAVFLFTDGNDNNSILSLEQTRYVMKTLDVPLFAIGIMDGFLPVEKKSEEPLNVGTLKALTTAGGGDLILARDYNDLMRMKADLEENLRAHYMMGFMVERGEGEKRHQIRVKTKKRLHIRHRNSYIGMPP